MKQRSSTSRPDFEHASSTTDSPVVRSVPTVPAGSADSDAQTGEPNESTALAARLSGAVARIVPLVLSAFIIVLDQVTKSLIVKLIPDNTIGASLASGLVRIIHTRNTGVAFSIGQGAPDTLRGVLFVVLPLVVLVGLVWFYFRGNGFTNLQRWAVAGILGGGLGNVIDRVFRPSGVVDFIDVKFFGILGMERWPTFNVADASVVVCGILLVISLVIKDGSQRNE